MQLSKIGWTARILGVGLAVFLGLFALDAFEPGRPVLQNVLGFVIHLAPSAIVLAVVALAWRRPWIGALVFTALAIAYAVEVDFRMDWVLGISGPLLLVGLLFFWSWRTDHVAPAH
jgi:hypothetical protein